MCKVGMDASAHESALDEWPSRLRDLKTEGHIGFVAPELTQWAPYIQVAAELTLHLHPWPPLGEIPAGGVFQKAGLVKTLGLIY